MAKARRIKDEVEARRYLKAASESGGPPADWARANGIDGRSLNAWRMNLSRRAKTAITPPRRRRSGPRRRSAANHVIELVPMAITEAGPAARTTSGRYVLEVDGVRVEFGDDFAEATLRRVLEVLRSC